MERKGDAHRFDVVNLREFQAVGAVCDRAISLNYGSRAVIDRAYSGGPAGFPSVGKPRDLVLAGCNLGHVFQRVLLYASASKGREKVEDHRAVHENDVAADDHPFFPIGQPRQFRFKDRRNRLDLLFQSGGKVTVLYQLSLEPRRKVLPLGEARRQSVQVFRIGELLDNKVLLGFSKSGGCTLPASVAGVACFVLSSAASLTDRGRDNRKHRNRHYP